MDEIPLIKAIPVRHPGRWLAAVVIVAAVLAGLQSIWTNPQFRWGTVRTYLFDVLVIRGIGWTLLLTVTSMVIAI
ncbi:amino acid ABC transporter permease, partial [Arthrobacter sp. STN4]|nr:amino acid ABC transporter permease [Arthrobacter sp. STN4]